MSNALAVNADAPKNILNGYTSIKGDDFDARKKVLTAVTNSTSLGDNLGKTIKLTDIIVQPVETESVNEQTGEAVTESYLRTTLIDESGEAYSTGSSGIASSIKNILDILGEPHTWPGSVPIKVVEKKGNKGYKFFTVELA